MATKNKLISVLSDAEQFALYGLPDFDDGQRLEYLSLSKSELALACSRPTLHAQAYCAVQIGYFKAKHAFFRFTWEDAPPLYRRGGGAVRATISAQAMYPRFARMRAATPMGRLFKPLARRAYRAASTCAGRYAVMRAAVAHPP